MTKPPCVCLECGNAIHAPRSGKEFCCSPCRMAFNNRRRDRGADMYDLFRALRRERDKAKALGLWTELCRLELKWQEEDEARRPGRRSYVPPRRALDNLYDKGALQRGEVLTKTHYRGRVTSRAAAQ